MADRREMLEEIRGRIDQLLENTDEQLDDIGYIVLFTVEDIDEDGEECVVNAQSIHCSGAMLLHAVKSLLK